MEKTGAQTVHLQPLQTSASPPETRTVCQRRRRPDLAMSWRLHQLPWGDHCCCWMSPLHSVHWHLSVQLLGLWGLSDLQRLPAQLPQPPSPAAVWLISAVPPEGFCMETESLSACLRICLAWGMPYSALCRAAEGGMCIRYHLTVIYEASTTSKAGAHRSASRTCFSASLAAASTICRWVRAAAFI